MVNVSSKQVGARRFGYVSFWWLAKEQIYFKTIRRKKCIYLVSGQEWGDPNDEPWLGLHGWLDNSGTFETLSPFFTENRKRLIAVDLPGHGLSSHYGPGIWHFA